MIKFIAYFISVSSVSLIPFHEAMANPNIINVENILSMQDYIRQLSEEIENLKNIPRVPPGTVVAFAGEKVPKGWLLCDGSAVNRQTYLELFEVLKTSHGIGDGSSTFNIPDYRGLFLRGVSHSKNNEVDTSASNRQAMKLGGNTGNKVGSIQLDSFKTHSHNSGGLKNSSSYFSYSGTSYPSNSTVYFTTSENGSHSHSYAGAARANGRFMVDGGTGLDVSSTNETHYSGSHRHSGSISLPNYSFSISSSISAQTISGSTSAEGDSETRPKNAYVHYIIKI
ncbi:hypothetical protein GCL60_04125 [Silvanigrella paludirubra]|uniref:Phage tail collar domain-containing protein n=1 Tax=Silvanigrella paludirubra TaxID=2499159 RepID=A0A6N6VYM1_9BACT|nr:phage tail protein [Silvanigrella paludirubra]KAB8039448.1 hypothetical protein GCL60_04125 [Silvanigrella paludirubra]